MKSVYFTEDDMCTTLKIEVKRIYDFFIANDWEISKDPEKADLVLCLSCSGWLTLEEASLERLKKLQYLGDKVVSFGCTNENNPSAIANIHKGKIITTQELYSIESLIPNLKVKLSDIPEPTTFKGKEDYRLYDLTKRFVNIAFGCSFTCSYCPHKVGLGPLKSRTIEDIVSSIEELVSGGVRIIVLTGMETALYGNDIGVTYPELLKRVMAIDADFEIHVAQFSPVGITKYYDDLLELFSSERITDIQIPIQTTSNRILKLMHRPLDTVDVCGFFEKLRKRNLKAVFRTDLIVGFPTETMEELDHSLKFATEVFDEIAVYGAEIRESLPAGKLLDKVFPEEELKRRIDYSLEFIRDCGKMAHGGQQSDVSLVEVEEQKKAVRNARLKIAENAQGAN